MANFGRNMTESWFGESASERNARHYEEPKSSFGFFQNAGVKSFDEHFEELCDRYKESKKIDIKRDIKGMLADPAFMEQYKVDLMQPVIEGFESVSENDPHIRSIVENVNRFWDTKVNFYNESASMTAYLPISTLEFPVLVKQFFSSIIKDIIEVETTKTPNISKHVRTMYIVDNNTGKEYEYPKCIWDGTWKEPFNASKGLPIDNNKLVDLGTNGKLFKYDIISNLTKGVRGLDQLSFAFRINAIQVDGKRIPLVGNGITVEECPTKCKENEEFKKYYAKNSYATTFDYDTDKYYDVVTLIIDQLVNFGPVASGISCYSDFEELIEKNQCKDIIYKYDGVSFYLGGHAVTIV